MECEFSPVVSDATILTPGMAFKCVPQTVCPDGENERTSTPIPQPSFVVGIVAVAIYCRDRRSHRDRGWVGDLPGHAVPTVRRRQGVGGRHGAGMGHLQRLPVPHRLPGAQLLLCMQSIPLIGSRRHLFFFSVSVRSSLDVCCSSPVKYIASNRESRFWTTLQIFIRSSKL